MLRFCMGRILLRSLVALLVAAALVYIGDFALWKLRDAHGTGESSITITRYVVAPLKGGKEEYYPDGTESVQCSRSLLPQAGSGACWWLARHRVTFDR